MSRNVIIKQSNSFLYLIIIILLSSIIFLLCKAEKKNNSIPIHNNDPYYDNPFLFYNRPQSNNISTMDNILKYKDPFQPPLKEIQIDTRFRNNEYSQMGILTREESDKHPVILPLMGRMVHKGDKIQYYTISNSGSNNTKLPIKKNGKYCTNERGCSELYTNDEVFVEGYKNSFKVTIYESKTFEYL